MAHGGSPEWNQTVLQAVEPLRGRYPVEVAFGMADACSLQESVRALEEKGVRKVGVVRLFVSGESWYERTEQILGLRDGAPPAKAGDCGGGEHAGPSPSRPRG
jgi:sirohydrochlorin cobaltochelatase